MSGRNSGGNVIDAIMFGVLLRLPFPLNLMFAIAMFYLVIAAVVIGVIAIIIGVLSYAVYQIAIQIAADVRLNRRESERATVLEMIASPQLRSHLEKSESSCSPPLLYIELQQSEADDSGGEAVNEFLHYMQKCPDAPTLEELYHVLGREELNRQKAVRVAHAKAAFMQGAIGIRLTSISRWLREVTDLPDSDARAWLVFWSMSIGSILFIVGCFIWYDAAYHAGRATADLQSVFMSLVR